MAKVTYVGPHDAVEVPHLNWQVFKNGEGQDVPSDQLGNFAEQDVWQVSGRRGKSPELPEAPPVDTTTPENLPTEPAPAVEGN
jgi:hypothetical protein